MTDSQFLIGGKIVFWEFWSRTNSEHEVAVQGLACFTRLKFTAPDCGACQTGAENLNEGANAQNRLVAARCLDVLVSVRQQSSASGSILDRHQQRLRKSALRRIDEASPRSRYARGTEPIRSAHLPAHSSRRRPGTPGNRRSAG